MKFLLSGYFGVGNFGDEAILKYAVDILRYYYKNANITVASKNPDLTKKTYNPDDVIYTFDIKAIINSLKACDYLIFPGGSVLQDTTSIKSIFYYLFVIFFAVFYKKKVLMISQGIGPVRNNFAKKIMFTLLKKTSLITVRDKKSFDLLAQNGIKCEQTADLLWAFTQKNSQSEETNSLIYGDLACNAEKQKVGIQLRNRKTLTDEKLKIIAKNVLKNFPMLEYDYKLICLQQSEDEQILVQLGKIMHELQPSARIELCAEKDIEKTVKLLQSVDYMIAMRFHAGVCAINAEKHLLVLSYDPKTEELCKELGMQYVDVDDINESVFNDALKWLKEFNPAKTALKTNILVKKAKENVDFLIKEIDNK